MNTRSVSADAALAHFAPFLDRWNLVASGDPISTRCASLLPVRRNGEPAMLKLSSQEDDRRGAVLMEWWAGEGAARVLARDGGALLMERAIGSASLSAMSRSGRDDEACTILCATAARLHASRGAPPAALVPLDVWFRDLEPAAARNGGVLRRAADTARALLAEPREVTVLHGDLHHANVLDFEARGWLAIDPMGLIGERGFDYANIFTNPDLADPSWPVATLPERFERRLEIVTREAGIERERMLRWVLAWTGLSAAWFLADEDPLAAIDLEIARLAEAALDR